MFSKTIVSFIGMLYGQGATRLEVLHVLKQLHVSWKLARVFSVVVLKDVWYIFSHFRVTKVQKIGNFRWGMRCAVFFHLMWGERGLRFAR